MNNSIESKLVEGETVEFNTFSDSCAAAVPDTIVEKPVRRIDYRVWDVVLYKSEELFEELVGTRQDVIILKRADYEEKFDLAIKYVNLVDDTNKLYAAYINNLRPLEEAITTISSEINKTALEKSSKMPSSLHSMFIDATENLMVNLADISEKYSDICDEKAQKKSNINVNNIDNLYNDMKRTITYMDVLVLKNVISNHVENLYKKQGEDSLLYKINTFYRDPLFKIREQFSSEETVKFKLIYNFRWEVFFLK